MHLSPADLRIGSELERALSVVGRHCGTRLDADRVATIRRSLAARFGDRPGLFSRFNMSPARDAIHDPSAELHFGEYVGERACILFYDSHQAHDSYGYLITSGSCLAAILDESFRFQHYVCDPELTYVLIATDDNVAIALGEARDWLRSLTRSMSKE